MALTYLRLLALIWLQWNSIRAGGEPQWVFRELTQPLAPHVCSETIRFARRTAGTDDRDRAEGLILLTCSEDQNDSGFTAYDVKCSADDQEGDAYRFSRLLFFVPTQHPVRQLKSIKVEERIFIIALIRDQHSLIYELFPEGAGEETGEKKVPIRRIQSLPFSHLSDVAVAFVSQTKDLFVSFASFFVQEGLTDQTRPQEALAPVYYFDDGYLRFCGFAAVMRTVSVRAWDHGAGATLVFAGYMDKDSSRSFLSFFDVSLDENGNCKVMPRHFQPTITTLAGQHLCGVQSMEVLQRDNRRYLAVAASPVANQHDCGPNALLESFILQPESALKHRFMINQFLSFPVYAQFSGFKTLRTVCGQILQAYGFLSRTHFFALHWSNYELQLAKVPGLQSSTNILHSSVGYCRKSPVVTYSTLDTYGLPITELSCNQAMRGAGEVRDRSRAADTYHGNINTDLLYDGFFSYPQRNTWRNRGTKSYKLRKAHFDAEKAKRQMYRPWEADGNTSIILPPGGDQRPGIVKDDGTWSTARSGDNIEQRNQYTAPSLDTHSVAAPASAVVASASPPIIPDGLAGHTSQNHPRKNAPPFIAPSSSLNQYQQVLPAQISKPSIPLAQKVLPSNQTAILNTTDPSRSKPSLSYQDNDVSFNNPDMDDHLESENPFKRPVDMAMRPAIGIPMERNPASVFDARQGYERLDPNAGANRPSPGQMRMPLYQTNPGPKTNQEFQRGRLSSGLHFPRYAASLPLFPRHQFDEKLPHASYP